MDQGSDIPGGFRGVRLDMSHYRQIHGVHGIFDSILLICRSPAIWALAVYRFGRWVRFGNGHLRGLSFLFRVLHRVLYEGARHFTRVFIAPWSEIEGGVWIESFAPVVLSANRIGAGTRIYGGVTLGAGGPRHARGVPTIGRNVVLAPGVIIVGPVQVPSTTVVGPNTVLSLSPAAGSGWLGVPAFPWKRSVLVLIPAAPAAREEGNV